MVFQNEHCLRAAVYILYLQEHVRYYFSCFDSRPYSFFCNVSGQSGNKTRKRFIAVFSGDHASGYIYVHDSKRIFPFFQLCRHHTVFMAVMIHQFYDDKNWGFAGYVKKFFIFSWTWFISLSEPFRHRITLKRGDGGEKRKINRNVTAALCGLIAALLFLLVVMPLLMTSDRIFSQVLRIYSEFLT